MMKNQKIRKSKNQKIIIFRTLIFIKNIKLQVLDLLEPIKISKFQKIQENFES